MSEPGTTEITYTVTDSAGNSASASRTVTVAADNAPNIALQGPQLAELELAERFFEPGYTASDTEDGALTGPVKVIYDMLIELRD